MSDLFEHLGRTIRSIFEDDKHSWDPDMKDAWQELNSFLDEESAFDEELGGDSERRRRNNPGSDYTGGATAQQSSPSLTKDFRNLELPVTATIEEVKKSYKRLLALYHPDRHTADPEKQRLATEITSRLNLSYDRICQYLGAK